MTPGKIKRFVSLDFVKLQTEITNSRCASAGKSVGKTRTCPVQTRTTRTTHENARAEPSRRTRQHPQLTNVVYRP
jgi:hypothetical protein